MSAPSPDTGADAEQIPASVPTKVASLFSRDAVSASLGMRITAAGSGSLTVAMTVGKHMLNGAGVAHGGVIFTLADTAFGLISNDSEDLSLGAGAEIVFLRTAHAGQTLTATAALRTLSGRTGIYDIRVVNEDGAVVAEFRGRSRALARP